MRAALGTILAAAAFLPGTAHAAPPKVVPAPIPAATVGARTITVMRAAYPQSPCLDRLSLQASTPTELHELAAADGLAPAAGVGLVGYAVIDSCTAYVRQDLSPLEFCAVAVHEAGHLSGLEHVDDPNSIMFARPDHYPACDRAFPRSRWERVYDTIRDWLPRAMIGLPRRHGLVYRIATRDAGTRNVWCLRWRTGRLYGPHGIVESLWGGDDVTLGDRCK